MMGGAAVRAGHNAHSQRSNMHTVTRDSTATRGNDAKNQNKLRRAVRTQV